MKLCVICAKRTTRTPRSKFCEECYLGSKPCSVEYAVTRAILRGELPPAKDCLCIDCGNQARHYDHRDYNKPLEVEPVCPRCNFFRGPAIRYGKTADGDPLPTSERVSP